MAGLKKRLNDSRLCQGKPHLGLKILVKALAQDIEMVEIASFLGILSASILKILYSKASNIGSGGDLIMIINLQLEYSSENKLIVLSNNNNKPYTHRNVLDIYRTFCDLIIKKLKRLETKSSSLPRR